MENPKIEWIRNSGKEVLKFTVDGTLTEQNTLTGIDNWRRCFRLYPSEKIILLWDCLKMSSYEPGSRSCLQSALKEMKSQIDCIWLVTNSTMIKIGASIISRFASLKIQVVRTEDEVYRN